MHDAFQPIEFHAYIGNCVDGEAESDQDVRVTWKDANGVSLKSMDAAQG